MAARASSAIATSRGCCCVAFVLALLAALPDALLALWLKLLGDGVLEHASGLVARAAIGLGVSAAGTWFLRTVSTRVQRRFRDKVTIALESHVARLQASVATIAHQERPEYLDRLAMLRNQVFVLDHMYMSLFSTCGWILRLGVTIALLMSIHPALALLALFALPDGADVDLAAGRRARGAGARRAGQPPGPPSVHDRDDRAAGQGSARHRHRRAADRRTPRGVGALVRAGRSARAGVRRAWHALAWAIFGARLRRRRRVRRRSDSRGAAGDVLLVLAAGSRLSAYIGATVGEIGFLRGIWMDGSRRLAWLEDYAASLVGVRRPAGARRARARAFASSTCRSPIRAPTRLVLDDVSLTLPAGAVVAIVGENGAGKTTLVKLLAQAVRADVGRDPRRRRRRWRACPPTSGVRGSPARSRTSSASSSARATPSASATCRVSTMSPRS